MAVAYQKMDNWGGGGHIHFCVYIPWKQTTSKKINNTIFEYGPSNYQPT